MTEQSILRIQKVRLKATFLRTLEPYMLMTTRPVRPLWTLMGKGYQGILDIQLTRFRAVVVEFVGGNAYGKDNY